MLIHWIWLAHRPGVSGRIKALLLGVFRDAEDIYCAKGSAFAPVEGLTKEAKASLEDKDLTQSRLILEKCRESGLQIITLQDAAYPARLKNIPDPPLVLYCRGQLPQLDMCPVIGVVGTRKASAYGLNTASRLGYQIAACGGIVVSGMAKGIDAMAMKGALLAGKPTVGVLGCGADVVYPLSNRQLFQDVEKYGCILSEFPPGTQPARWTFPRRNRIISGLSNGVLVVEAPEKSGALITANLALEQGRDVFVVPGNVDQDGFVGSNRLLRDGAAVVSTGWDVVSEYAARYPDTVREKPEGSSRKSGIPLEPELQPEQEKPAPKVAQKPKLPEKKRNLKENLNKKAIDKDASGSYSDVNEVLPGLSEDAKKIVAVLREGERLTDDVIAQTGLGTGKLLALLTMLELKGVIRRLPGKRITLAVRTKD